MRSWEVIWLWLDCWVFIGKSITILSPCVTSSQSVPCRPVGMSWSVRSSRSESLGGLGERENWFKANTILKCVFFCQDSLSPPHPFLSTPDPPCLEHWAAPGAQGSCAKAPDQPQTFAPGQQRIPISAQFHARDTWVVWKSVPGLSPAWEYQRENVLFDSNCCHKRWKCWVNVPECHHYPWIYWGELQAKAHMPKQPPDGFWAKQCFPICAFFWFNPMSQHNAIRRSQSCLNPSKPCFPKQLLDFLSLSELFIFLVLMERAQLQCCLCCKWINHYSAFLLFFFFFFPQ